MLAKVIIFIGIRKSRTEIIRKAPQGSAHRGLPACSVPIRREESPAAIRSARPSGTTRRNPSGGPTPHHASESHPGQTDLRTIPRKRLRKPPRRNIPTRPDEPYPTPSPPERTGAPDPTYEPAVSRRGKADGCPHPLNRNGRRTAIAARHPPAKLRHASPYERREKHPESGTGLSPGNSFFRNRHASARHRHIQRPTSTDPHEPNRNGHTPPCRATPETSPVKLPASPAERSMAAKRNEELRSGHTDLYIRYPCGRKNARNPASLACK